jgi:hypothetical protein
MAWSAEETNRTATGEQFDPNVDLQDALAFYFDSESDTSEEKRRHHRESMATARKQLRMSIDKLQREEGDLERRLRRTIANFKPLPPTDPRQKLHSAYYELVKEQLQEQTERANLEQTYKEKDKYERLVQRELDRVSTSTSDQMSDLDTDAKS